MNKMDEQILVVPRDVLFKQETLTFQGVETDENVCNELLHNLSTSYSIMRRGDAEDDPTFKQPIPYVLIRRNEDIFVYKRLSGGGETRLHDKLSIGAGGHMNEFPAATTFQDTLLENLNRELAEELFIQSNDQKLTFFGYINDDENEVGKVHIGVLALLDVSSDAIVEVRETEQLEGAWMSLSDLKEDTTFAKLESWSQIAVKALF